MSKKDFEKMLVENGYSYLLGIDRLSDIEKIILRFSNFLSQLLNKKPKIIKPPQPKIEKINYCICNKGRKRKKDDLCFKCGNVILYKKPKYKHRETLHIDIFNKFFGHINKCQKCESNKYLQIHHINKNRHDNHPFNLMKLCIKCHCEAHKGDRVYNLMKSRLNSLNKKGIC